MTGRDTQRHRRQTYRLTGKMAAINGELTMKNRQHRIVAAYQRMHQIRQQREIRSELVLRREVVAAVFEFDPDMAGQLCRAFESNRRT